MEERYLNQFTPLPKADGGFAQVSLAGTSLLAALVPVPSDATSAWVQPSADITFRLDGDDSTPVGFALPAITWLPISNITMMQQLVLTGEASITVQFGIGPVGPIPPTP